MPPKKTRRASQKVRKSKVPTADDLLCADIKIVDEGQSGIEMTAEERRKKREEEKAKAVLEEQQRAPVNQIILPYMRKKEPQEAAASDLPKVCFPPNFFA